MVMKHPDSQLYDYKKQMLQDRGLDVSISTIWRTLQDAGYSLKTITKAACERNYEKRARYVYEIMQYQPRELVFIDESSFDKRTCNRLRGWAKLGGRIIRPVFFLRGARYSILPALSLNDGIFHVEVVQGSFTMDTFNQFIRNLLNRMNPYDADEHPPRSVIVLDNCQIHKDPEILNYIIERGMRYVFLPPYSPDFNPIELAFSSMKAWFRKNNELVRGCWERESLARRLLINMAFTASPEKAVGWFKKCRYLEDY